MLMSLNRNLGSSSRNGLTRQTSSPSSQAEFVSRRNITRAAVVFPTHGGPPIKMSLGLSIAGCILLGDLLCRKAESLETLTAESLSLDDLVRRTGIDSGPAASAMTMLVIKGLVAQKPGNIFARNNL